MARNFDELRAKMSPERRARSTAKARRMLLDMGRAEGANAVVIRFLEEDGWAIAPLDFGEHGVRITATRDSETKTVQDENGDEGVAVSRLAVACGWDLRDG